MMIMKIDITCDTCGDTYQVTRTDEIPEDCTKLMCNWCPICDDNGKADCDYEERYYYHPPININQLTIQL